MGKLQQLICELRQRVRTVVEPPNGSFTLRPDDIEPFRRLDAQIAAECLALGIPFPDLHIVSADDKHRQSFGFTKLPYVAVVDAQDKQRPAWVLMPNDNWWQCLSIMEELANSRVGQKAENPASPRPAKFDEFPETLDGHMSFLEFARSDMETVAFMKHHQQQEGHSNDAIRQHLPLGVWEEAKRRFEILAPKIPGEATNALASVFEYPLTEWNITDVEGLFRPAVSQLRAAFQNSRSRIPAAGATGATSHEKAQKRRCYDRDHLWLKWRQEGLGLAAIRDRWNSQNPGSKIETGESGRDSVKKGIKRAETENSSTGEN